MGYSILLVDDDRILVEKLESTVHWEKIGISVVLTALNIRQAKEILEQYPINIILCDVDMPQGNGLELMEWVRDREMKIECIFLSGYANFAYAQKAMALSSREYLLKPISNRELEYSLGHLTEEMDRKNSAKRKEGDNTRYQFWREIFHGSYQEEKLVEEAFQKHFPGDNDLFLLFTVRMLEELSRENYKRDLILLDFAITNILEEYFSEYELECIMHTQDLEWQCAIHLKQTDTRINDDFIQLRDRLKDLMHHSLILYVAQPRTLNKILDARNALQQMQKIILPDQESLYFEEPEKLSDRELPDIPWNVWEKETQAGENPREIGEEIIACLQDLNQKGALQHRHMKKIMRQIEKFLDFYLQFHALNFPDIFDEEQFEAKERLAEDSFFGLADLIRWISVTLEGNWNNANHSDVVVEQMKNYIRDHLNEDLSRTILAQHVFLSEDYVSKIFSKSTGMSISGYVSAERMKKAQEYLSNTGESISRIALKVGFTNFSYFSKMFREYSGFTPNEYRTRNRK